MPTLVNNLRAIRGPVTAVPMIGASGVVVEPDTVNNQVVVRADETVIWTVPAGYESSNNYYITLLESIQNFEEVAVYCKCTRLEDVQVMIKNVYPVCDAGNLMFADGVSTNHWNVTNTQNNFYTCGIDIRLQENTGYVGENYRFGLPNGSTTPDGQRMSDSSIWPHPYKIVGIKRRAG